LKKPAYYGVLLRLVSVSSNLGNENFDAGHFQCSRGPQVPRSCSKHLKLRCLEVVRHSIESSVFAGHVISQPVVTITKTKLFKKGILSLLF